MVLVGFLLEFMFGGGMALLIIGAVLVAVGNCWDFVLQAAKNNRRAEAMPIAIEKALHLPPETRRQIPRNSERQRCPPAAPVINGVASSGLDSR